MNIPEMEAVCKQVRRDIITMTAAAGSGHPGGSLSATEILVALYEDVMKVDPKNPNDPARDRLVLSKGHAAPALYAVLAKRDFLIRKSSPISGSCTAFCRATPIRKSAPAWMRPPVLWVRALPLRSAWRWAQSIPATLAMCTLFWATASCRKVWFGKRPCPRLTISWTT